MTPDSLAPSSIRPADRTRLATTGLRSRPARAALSALGIMIGITAMVSVLGIASSSRARLDQQLDALGTNLVSAKAGTDPQGRPTILPETTLRQARTMTGMESATTVAALGQNIYRNRFIDPAANSGLTVMAADLRLPEVLGTTVSRGNWLNEATSQLPAVVLGRKAAERLGVNGPGTNVTIGTEPYTVVGIMDPTPLAPEMDYAAMIGEPIARTQFGYQGNPTTVYGRGDPGQVTSVLDRLAPTIDPEDPSNVTVSRPSDALAAKDAADGAFTGLLLGLGAIALLVGSIGVANTMIISVFERRGEIGLRRALGATRGHIRSQFLSEALVLSLLGGMAGAAAGIAVTAAVALTNDWPIAIQPIAVAAAIGATVVAGVAAGIYPASRAARTSPTAALSA